jgi:hypothetical protein
MSLGLPYKVSLFGTSISGSKKVIAYRDLKSTGNPVIVVDTTRATGIDLEAILEALSAITEFSPSNQAATRARLSTPTTPRSATARERAAQEDAALLRRVLTAQPTCLDGLGCGRVIETTVTRGEFGRP